MRISTFLLFFFVTLSHAESSYSQKAKVSIKHQNTRLELVLNEIENQTDYLFLYNENQIDANQMVSVNVKEMPVNSLLDKLFSKSQIQYMMEGTHIILTKNGSATGAVQQSITITGTVTDETGLPLPGVSIVLKGTTSGVISDINGAYSIHVPGNGAVLIFSYIGYIKQEITISDQHTVNISLMEDTNVISEVVVIGYGTARRVNVAGAISTADAKTFESRPVQNAAAALQGQIPGLTITRNSGAPGSTPTIRVRDVSSLNGGAPLVLIDGAEGELDKINPADIENISVLKDGTAAIYGARAADGVLLVTTKSGRKKQPLKVSLDANYSIKTPALMKKTVSLYEYAMMGLEITDGSFIPEYTAEDIPLIEAGSDLVVPNGIWGEYPKWYKSQNWRDLSIGNGSLQNYNLNLTGGGEKYSYLVSLGYQNEQGLPKFGVDKEERYFIRAKSNIEIFKGLDYELNLSYNATDRQVSTGIDLAPNNIWEVIYKARCWQPMYNPAGNFYLFQGFSNPAQVAAERGETDKTRGNFTFNNSLKWEAFKGFNIIGRAIVSKRDGDDYIEGKKVFERNWDDQIVREAYSPNWMQRNYRKTLYKNFTLYGEYKKRWGELHDFSAMLGASNESSDYDYFSAQRNNYTQQEIMALPLGSADNQQTSGDGNAWVISSVFSRLSYSFAEKYIIDAVLRADASSRFADGYRWGYFPGVSAAWRLGEEKFMKNMKIFDDLKLRASYGEMGNQSGIGYYDYIQLISIDAGKNYPFGKGSKGQLAKPGNMVSTTRTWETIASTDVGIDFGLLNNRLYGSFDYFWKTNKDMLIPVTYPETLGADAPATNNGRLDIKGWEVVLGWRDQIEDFRYSVRASLSDAQNKIVEKGGTDNLSLGLNQSRKGYPINSYFGYVFDGIIQNEQQLNDYKSRFQKGGVPNTIRVGDAMYRDLDGDGVLSVLGDGKKGSGDAIYLGDRNPRYSFGFNFNAAYKGFDLGFFLQGIAKRTTFLEGAARMPFEQSWWDPLEYWYGKTWTADRTDARYPAITLQDKRNYNYQYSSNVKFDAAYLRLKNIQFGYTIPQSLTAKVKIEKVRMYFSGEDLFEVHNVPGGWDPESDEGVSSYPFTRNYSLGLNVTF